MCVFTFHSFKTKGNLTKHLRSKAHYKRCVEMGVVPVPTVVDESHVNEAALALQVWVLCVMCRSLPQKVLFASSKILEGLHKATVHSGSLLCGLPCSRMRWWSFEVKRSLINLIFVFQCNCQALAEPRYRTLAHLACRSFVC